MSDTPPDEQDRPRTGEEARLLAQATPAVRAEYEAAKEECGALGLAMGRALSAREEADAVGWARALRGNAARVALRWCRARAALRAGLIVVAPKTGAWLPCGKCGAAPMGDLCDTGAERARC